MKVLLWIFAGIVGLVVLAVLVLLALGLRGGANEIRNSITISRPPAEVFAWLTEPDKLKQWISWLVEVRIEGQPGVPGSRAVMVMDDPSMKKRVEMSSTLVKSDPPRLVELKLEMPGMFTGDISYALEPKDGGTLVNTVFRFHYDVFFARLLEPLITPQAKKKQVMDFATLKTKAEAAPIAQK
jgi:uncharacterized protein YndB with AHSA1/START domain